MQACSNIARLAFLNPRIDQAYSEKAIRRVREVGRAKAGISKELTLYDASRHSVATQLLNAGVPLGKIRELQGHSDIRTTEKYAHGQVETLRADLKRLSLANVISINIQDEIAQKNIKN